MPIRVEPAEHLGPRHYCFHPTQNILYFSNEQGCSVTGYRLDTSAGTLSAFQTITTLPAGYTERNTCSQIQITPVGDILVCAEPRPQQYRGLLRRCLLRAVDGHRARIDRSGPKRLQPRPRGQIRLRRRFDVEPSGLVSGQS